MGGSRRGGRRRWPHAAWALALLCLLLGRPAAAAPGPPPLRDYAIDAWTTRNGLRHNSLRDMAQTGEGYLWFATWEGVVRYNGVEFTPFDRGTTPGLRDNGVGALYVDLNGTLWLSDSRGNLGRLGADGTWEYLERAPQWPRALVHDMAMDAAGRLWLLFENHGLGCVHPDGRLEYIAPPPGIPLPASYPRLAIDAAGNLWIGTLEGLVLRAADGRWRHLGPADGLPPGLAWPYLAPDGTLWVAAGERVFRRDGGRFAEAHVVPGAGYFTSMLRDREGSLWLGTENRGVIRIGPHGQEWLPPERLAQGRIASLLEDAEGSIWIGANGGLFRLREALFTGWGRRDGLRSEYVRAVLEDAAGTLWVGSAGGLDRLGADGRFHPVPLDGGNGHVPSILSLAEGRDGDLWAGTFADGVFRLRGGRLVQRYGQADGVPSGHVRAIAVDAAGQVWVGTRAGVVRVDGAGVHPPPAVPGMPRGLVTALAAIDGGLWIGSVEGASVLRADGTVERVPLEQAGGDPRTVFGFHKVGDAVWITSDRGLYRVRGGRLARVGLEQGLPVDTVFSLLADAAGNAWITSNRGVLRLPLAALEAAADGAGGRLPLQHYTEIDGLPSAQGNGSSSPAAIRRRDGSLWIATAAGVASVDPARLARYADRPPPPPVIEAVSVDGRTLDWHALEALPGGSRLAVTYAGLSYLLPERIRYRARLLGLDQDWIERGTRRDVEFVGLPPGRYTLEVQAAHPGGGWSPAPARWSFQVRPLWWQRGDVRLAGALLALLLLYGLYRYRVHRYEARSRRLERLVDARTADLRAQAQRLREIDRERAGLLERLREQAEAYARQAREDALTGLPNRRRFEETLARDLALARRGGRPLCLALLDIDHFKRINDTRSHTVGDQVLREFGRLLASQHRGSDLVARLGGEEFALLMPDIRLDEALAACERLQARVRAHRPWAGLDDLQVSFSLGLVELRPGEGAEELYRRADAALYQAKRAGRDRLQLG